MKNSKKPNQDAWAVAFLAVLPFLFYFNWFSGFRTGFWTFGDGVYSYLSYRRALVDAWHAHHLPLWNEWINMGLPLIGDPQLEAFYPPNLLFLVLPFAVALNLLIMLHYSLASAATFLFLRELKLCRFSSIVGAMVFAFSGAINARRGHISVQHTLVWLPVLFLCYERLAKTHILRWACLLAIAIAMQFLAGFMQAWVYSMIALAIYMLYSLRRYPSKSLWLRESLLAGTAALALIAGQLIPTLASTIATHRASVSFEIFESYSFPIKHLRTLVNPFFFGLPHIGTPFRLFLKTYCGENNMTEFACYAGALPLVAALFLALRRFRVQRSLFWVAFGASALLLSLGGNLPWLAKLVFHVPLLKSFRVPARFLFLFDFAAAAMAALCLDALEREVWDSRAFRYCVRAYFLYAAGLTWFSVRHGYLLPDSPELWTTPLVALALLGIAELLLRRRASASPILVKGAIGALVALDLWSFAFFNSNVFAPNDLSSRLAQVVREVDPAGRYRFVVISGLNGDLSYDSLGHDRNMFHSIRSLTGYTTFVPKTFLEALRVDEGGGFYDFDYLVRNRKLLSAFNTRWIIVNNQKRSAPIYRQLAGAFKFLRTDGDYDIFENPSAMPLAFGVAQTIHSPGNVVDGFDYTREAIVDEGQREQEFRNPVAISNLQQTEGRISAMTRSDDHSFVVFSETYARGWTGRIDGHPVKVVKTNGLLVGLDVPPGEHQIEVYFEPLPYYAGFAVSGLAAVALIVGLFSGIGNRRLQYEIEPAQAPVEEPLGTVLV